MITKEMIARINELARKKRSDGLTTEETAEQKKLYAAASYISALEKATKIHGLPSW